MNRVSLVYKICMDEKNMDYFDEGLQLKTSVIRSVISTVYNFIYNIPFPLVFVFPMQVASATRFFECSLRSY